MIEKKMFIYRIKYKYYLFAIDIFYKYTVVLVKVVFQTRESLAFANVSFCSNIN